MGRKPKQLSLFDMSQDAVQYAVVATRARRKKKKGDWRGMVAIPPGSLLEDIIQEFEAKTNIALEIPLTTFLHYVSGALVERESVIDFQGRRIDADIWSIVLAPSGGGKTWTQKEIGGGLGDVVPVIDSGAASAAAWLQSFASRPRGLWVRDEFFQLLKSIEQPGPMADLKDYLLRVYDNAKIERETKKDKIVLDNPALSILGFTALKPFTEGVSVESLMDGFAQRFGLVLARQDERRPWRDFPVWNVKSDDWAERFRAMIDGVLPSYSVNKKAEELFFKKFQSMAGNVPLEESFYRRILWRAHKLALIFHVIRGAGADPVLTEEDYGWAVRLVELQLSDAGEILEMCMKTDLARAIDAVEEIARDLTQKKQPITARAIVSRTRLVQNVATARFVMSVLGIDEARR